MIQAETEKQKQIEYLQRLMELPNAVSKRNLKPQGCKFGSPWSDCELDRWEALKGLNRCLNCVLFQFRSLSNSF
jgi:hypothetical protein